MSIIDPLHEIAPDNDSPFDDYRDTICGDFLAVIGGIVGSFVVAGLLIFFGLVSFGGGWW
jgi:hypothetical protein